MGNSRFFPQIGRRILGFGFLPGAETRRGKITKKLQEKPDAQTGSSLEYKKGECPDPPEKKTSGWIWEWAWREGLVGEKKDLKFGKSGIFSRIIFFLPFFKNLCDKYFLQGLSKKENMIHFRKIHGL